MNSKYIVKRVFYSFLILAVVITLNFFLPRIVFDDPAEPYLRGVPDDQFLLRQEIKAEYGFDKSIAAQYLIYLKKVVVLDFGYSMVYKQPVFSVMFGKIPWSMVLSVTSMIISTAAGIIWGASAAQKRGKLADKSLLKIGSLITALPSFWLALIFVMLLSFTIPIFPYRGAMTEGYRLTFNSSIFIVSLSLFIFAAILLYKLTKKVLYAFIAPVIGFVLSVFFSVPIGDTLDVLYHAALPVAVISIGGVVSYALMVRNSMIAVVNEDYILTAKAKGLKKKQILYGHTMRNALLPMVTNIGMSIAGIFSGSVIIEKIFTWPGMGTLLLEAQNIGDFQLAQAIMFFYSFITIFANLITDFIYHKLDPRVKVA